MTHALTMQHFFNSFLLETGVARVEEQEVRVPLNAGRELVIPLTYVSAAGRHRYCGDILIEDASGQRPVDFDTAMGEIVEHHFDSVSDSDKTRFVRRVADSDDYVKRADAALQARPVEPGFIASEQSLSGGHSMHPAPKCNEPLTVQEQETYLPEFAGQFAIEWFAVKRDCLVGEYVGGDMAQALLSLFTEQTGHDDSAMPGKEWLPLPMHPVQALEWRRSRGQYALGADAVQDLQLSSGGWTATSSSRAIYHPQCRWMLKVSLPVRLTNSLRLMTEPEARRGTQFSKLMQTAAGEELQQRFARAHFIEEPMWCSVRDDHGATLDLPLVSFRCNPFYAPQSEEASLQADRLYMLASLNQDAPGNQDNLISQWIKAYAEHNGSSAQQAAREWMSAFMQRVMAPLCVARSDYGIVMLAHQQNLLLEIEQGMPVGVAIRDCQGFGLTTLAKERFAEVLDNEAPQYFMEWDELNPYHAYYVIGNTLLNTIASIAASGVISEAELWHLCRNEFDALAKQHPKDESFYQYVLQSPTLRWKRNFYCFLSAHNEATLKDPSIIYCDIDNPLRWPHEESKYSRIHKPLPQGRRVTIIEPAESLSATQFELVEHGRCVAIFSRQMAEPGICQLHTVSADVSDAMLWWSAIEHAFYTSQASEVHIPGWPEGAKQLSKSEFLEQSPLWLHAPKDSCAVTMTTAVNGSRHPLRPLHPTGVVFQRYFYHLKRTLTFRVIEIERDLATFHRWHNNPVVAKMWELEGSLAEHRQYLNKQKQDDHIYGLIAEFDGVSFGYLEVYWAAEDRIGPHYQYGQFDKGVHMLVGNFAYRGGTYFDTWAKSIVHYCFQQEPRTESVVGEPRADNPRVLKLNARVGMQVQFEFDFPHKRSALILCGRDRFFQQFAF